MAAMMPVPACIGYVSGERKDEGDEQELAHGPR